MTRRAGRPSPGGRDTRVDILDPARALFADLGFERTTMRAVATRAGVDVALIYHHFGSKDDLLAAALTVPNSAQPVLRAIPAGTPDPGRAVANAVLELWESDPALRGQALAMIRTALSHEHAAQLLRERTAPSCWRWSPRWSPMTIRAACSSDRRAPEWPAAEPLPGQGPRPSGRRPRDADRRRRAGHRPLPHRRPDRLRTTRLAGPRGDGRSWRPRTAAGGGRPQADLEFVEKSSRATMVALLDGAERQHASLASAPHPARRVAASHLAPETRTCDLQEPWQAAFRRSRARRRRPGSP